MFTFMDLTIVVVMALAAAAVLSLVLMFATKNRTLRQVCFYFVVALGVYIATVGYRINWIGFEGQAALAVAMALVSIGALVMDRLCKTDEKKLQIARLMAAAALIVGMCNAFLI